MLQNSGSQAVTPQMLSKSARTARQRIRLEGGGYCREGLRALAQRVEVAEGEVRLMGSKSRLLQTRVANGGANAVPTQGLKWRTGWDSNPRWGCPHGGFQDRCLKPLGHPSCTAPRRHWYRVGRGRGNRPFDGAVRRAAMRRGWASACQGGSVRAEVRVGAGIAWLPGWDDGTLGHCGARRCR